MSAEHISDHDLEQYYLGMMTEEAELALLEEHILACGWCAERAQETQIYVDAMRVAALACFENTELDNMRLGGDADESCIEISRE